MAILLFRRQNRDCCKLPTLLSRQRKKLPTRREAQIEAASVQLHIECSVSKQRAMCCSNPFSARDLRLSARMVQNASQ
jgi:hypothetical protein